MSPELYERAVSLFHDLRGMSARDRAAAIDSRCGDQPELRRLVESMLRAEEGTEFLRPGAMAPLAVAVLEERAAHAPQRLGSYTLIRKLGEGGMGVVYEAEQESPSRRVAVKVMRPGLIADAMAKRFEREIAIAGRLCFPGIAQVFEAGAHRDASGLATPYFSMELVEGVPIDTFCVRDLPHARDRARLLASVCDAVAYAHANGVIHRDLKPANILVSRGATGEIVAKILDFGVARLAGPGEHTLATEAGQVVGTLAYMSPEQVSGGEVGPASDVYALGVILFEVLTGRSPYPKPPSTVAEAIRTVCETEPSRLGEIARPLAGDLETIIGRAMEKEPLRRYRGAGAMAEDLRRYLRDEPILARPPSMGYTVRKFAKRNPGVVGAVVGAFVVLAAALAVVGRYAYLEAAAHTLADQHAAEAREQAAVTQAVNEFINDSILLAAVPERLGKDAKVLQALDLLTEKRIATLAKTPLAEALVRFTVGSVYNQVDQDAKAEPHLKRAVELFELHAPGSVKLAEASNQLGLLISHHDAAASLVHFERAIELFARNKGESNEFTLGARVNLGKSFWLSDHADEALRHAEDVIATVDRLDLGAPRSLRAALMLKAQIFRKQGHLDRALATLLDMKARADRARSTLEPDEANHLGFELVSAGRGAQAIPILAPAYDENVAKAGIESAITQAIAYSLGRAHLADKRYADAVRVVEPVTRSIIASGGFKDPRSAIYAGLLCEAFRRSGRESDSEAMATEALAGIAGTDTMSANTGRKLFQELSLVLLNAGRLDEAEAALVKYEAALPPATAGDAAKIIAGYRERIAASRARKEKGLQAQP